MPGVPGSTSSIERRDPSSAAVPLPLFGQDVRDVAGQSEQRIISLTLSF
jgi:hypothetical protein